MNDLSQGSLQFNTFTIVGQLSSIGELTRHIDLVAISNLECGRVADHDDSLVRGKRRYASDCEIEINAIGQLHFVEIKCCRADVFQFDELKVVAIVETGDDFSLP